MEQKRKIRRDALVEEYRGFVDQVTKKLIRRMGLPHTQFDEFAAAGYLGLVEAASRFNKKAGASFKTFAYSRIRGAIIDSIRECSEVSGAGYRYARALQAAQELREDHFAQAAQRQTKRAGTGGKSDERNARLSEVLEYAAKSAFAFRMSMVDAEREVIDYADASDPETHALIKEQAKMFGNLVAALPEKERLIVEEYYYKGKSFAEIIESHEGLSKGWVSRLHSRALDLLRIKYEEMVRTGNA